MPAQFSPTTRQEFFSSGCWISQGPSYLTLDHEPPHLDTRPRCPSRSPLTGQAEN